MTHVKMPNAPAGQPGACLGRKQVRPANFSAGVAVPSAANDERDAAISFTRPIQGDDFVRQFLLNQATRRRRA